MKFSEYIKEEKSVSLIGLTINGQIVTRETPHVIWEGNFECAGFKLTSLDGAPKGVNGSFYCNENKLTSLKGGPKKVYGAYDCERNKLTSLEGAPEEVSAYFSCDNNKIRSLKDIHKQITTINGSFYCIGNPIKSHVLGLLLIRGIKEIVGGILNDRWVYILNMYLDKGRAGLIECQNELIDAGLEEYAQL